MSGRQPKEAWAALEKVAWDALERAHAPYSQFPVGAALETEDGTLIAGCNLENASLGLGQCAERVAVFSALAQGRVPGRRLVIVSRDREPTPPCGGCREVLRSFAPRLEIVSISATGRHKHWTLRELLPRLSRPSPLHRFDSRALITAKREGRELTGEELDGLVKGVLRGEVEPYQMSEFMMAVFLQGMTRQETRNLTSAMLDSGDRLDLSAIASPIIDKHSTGGVGDKISIPLVPLVLAAGLHVPMISGRGLGHTGGTLDKLGSIPGYRTQIPIEGLSGLVRDPGGFIAGQTQELVPADRILYALRDVSATIESVPLIVSSILSKKLAAGLTGLVLDVKFGRGAFMPDLAKAEVLAEALVGVAGDLGLPAVALLTRMDEPIGTTVGNALEVRESIELLTTRAPAADFLELTRALGGLMLALAGTVRTMGEGADVLEKVRRSGRGMEHCRRWIGAQGGDPRVLVDPERLEVSELTRTVRADRAGYVRDIDALLAGNLCVQLGGGRRRMGEEIDTRVGLLLHRKRGDRVEPGDPLFTLYLPAGAPADQLVEGEDALYVIGDEAPEARELVAKLITPRGSPADPGNAPVADACRSVVRGGR